MSETKMWGAMSKKMPGVKQRIEDSYSVGIADVNWLYQSREIWIELKYSDAHINLGSNRLRTIGLSPEQGVWLRSRKINGGNAFVLLRCVTATKSQWWLFNDHFIELAKPKRDPKWLETVCADVWYGSFDWERIWNLSH